MEVPRQTNTYGHLAVHYRNRQEGHLAARLLREIGFTECYSMEQPGEGGTFFHFVIDETANRGTDRIFYLLAMPEDVIDVFGFALHLAQTGKKHEQAKPLKGFGGAGVLEVVADHMGDT